MGLLDGNQPFFSLSDDPERNAALQQGLLSAAFGTLSGRNLAEGLSRGGLMGLNAYNTYGQAGLDTKLKKLQLADMEQKVALDKTNAERQGKLLDYFSQFTSPDAQTSAANQAVVGQTGGLAPTVQNGQLQTQARAALPQQNPMYGIDPRVFQADLAFNQGKGIPEMLFKRSTPNMQFQNGVAFDMNNVKPGASVPTISQNGQASQLIPDPTAPGGFRVQAPAGAVDTYAGYQRAEQEAKAPYQLVDVFDQRTQTNRKVPLSSIVQPPQPQPQQPQPSPNVIPPAQQAARNADSVSILQAELARATDPADRAAISRELQRVQQSGSPTGVAGNQASAPGVQTAPSLPVQRANEAGKELNSSFIKSEYEPTQETGRLAGDTLASVKTARFALSGIGDTGFGAQGKVAAARVLGALGVPQAENYASNGALFAQAAMDRLKTTLDASKGPQTEGDAQRAGQIFASINAPKQANQYILDLVEAKAQRDQMKASYYRDATPLARDQGDLSEVSRRWSNLQPSIFEMPSMAKWKGRMKQ